MSEALKLQVAGQGPCTRCNPAPDQETLRASARWDRGLKKGTSKQGQREQQVCEGQVSRDRPELVGNGLLGTGGQALGT